MIWDQSSRGLCSYRRSSLQVQSPESSRASGEIADGKRSRGCGLASVAWLLQWDYLLPPAFDWAGTLILNAKVRAAAKINPAAINWAAKEYEYPRVKRKPIR